MLGKEVSSHTAVQFTMPEKQIILYLVLVVLACQHVSHVLVMFEVGMMDKRRGLLWCAASLDSALRHQG